MHPGSDFPSAAPSCVTSQVTQLLRHLPAQALPPSPGRPCTPVPPTSPLLPPQHPTSLVTQAPHCSPSPCSSGQGLLPSILSPAHRTLCAPCPPECGLSRVGSSCFDLGRVLPRAFAGPPPEKGPFMTSDGACGSAAPHSYQAPPEVPRPPGLVSDGPPLRPGAVCPPLCGSRWGAPGQPGQVTCAAPPPRSLPSEEPW